MTNLILEIYVAFQILKLALTDKLESKLKGGKQNGKY